jgi:hypothetical protein
MVITMRGAGKGRDGFGFKTVIPPEDVFTDSYFGLAVKSKSEAESLMTYLDCPIVNFMLASRKNSQNISGATLKSIPLPPLDRMWTDEKVKAWLSI